MPELQLDCSCRGRVEHCPRCCGSGIIDGERFLLLARGAPHASRGVRRAVDLFVSYHAYGLLPIAGGIAEQSASFVEAIHIARGEVGAMELKEQREEEAKMDRERLRASANAARNRRR